MNTPIKILDLANYLNKENKTNSSIKITALEKKEKKKEELLNFNESVEVTNDHNCYRIRNSSPIDIGIRKNIIDIVRINKNLDSELLESNIRLAHEKII